MNNKIPFQGQILALNQNIKIYSKDARAKNYKMGAQFWVTSTDIQHKSGIVKIAPKNKPMGYDFPMAMEDYQKFFEEIS